MKPPVISIVTPTFNRCDTISRCIDSAVAFCRAGNINDLSEMIVVDDCSTDGTVDLVAEKYADLIQKGWLRLVTRGENHGFLSTRNLGVRHASGDWVIFLDSDDEIIPDSASKMIDYMTNVTQSFLYFRCLDGNTRTLIGPATETHQISYPAYINSGTPAEALPVIKRDLVARYPYDEDMRASAGLAYARMMKEGQTMLWTDCAGRVFYQNRSDRLTHKRFARAKFFLRGYVRFLNENFWGLKWAKTMELVLKISVYGVITALQKLKIMPL